MTGDSLGPVPALVTAPATPAKSRQGLDDPARVAQARRLSSHIREEAIERLAVLAAQLTGAPNAEVSILSDRHVLVGIHGREVPEADREGPLERSLCMLAVAAGAALSVADAPADKRIGHLPPR